MTYLILQSGLAEGIGGMWPLLLMFVVMWFFFIRPQNKKQKEQQAFISSEIQKGDEVATSAGIIGRISKIDGNIVTLQIDTKTFMRVTKGAISKEMTASINATESES